MYCDGGYGGQKEEKEMKIKKGYIKCDVCGEAISGFGRADCGRVKWVSPVYRDPTFDYRDRVHFDLCRRCASKLTIEVGSTVLVRWGEVQ